MYLELIRRLKISHLQAIFTVIHKPTFKPSVLILPSIKHAKLLVSTAAHRVTAGRAATGVMCKNHETVKFPYV